jgi:hypothetical protein
LLEEQEIGAFTRRFSEQTLGRLDALPATIIEDDGRSRPIFVFDLDAGAGLPERKRVTVTADLLRLRCERPSPASGG